MKINQAMLFGDSKENLWVVDLGNIPFKSRMDYSMMLLVKHGFELSEILRILFPSKCYVQNVTFEIPERFPDVMKVVTNNGSNQFQKDRLIIAEFDKTIADDIERYTIDANHYVEGVMEYIRTSKEHPVVVMHKLDGIEHMSHLDDVSTPTRYIHTTRHYVMTLIDGEKLDLRVHTTKGKTNQDWTNTPTIEGTV